MFELNLNIQQVSEGSGYRAHFCHVAAYEASVSA